MDFLLILTRFIHKEATDLQRAGQGPGSGFGSRVKDETWPVEAFKCKRNLSSTSIPFNFIGQRAKHGLGLVAMMLDRLITDVSFSLEHTRPVFSKIIKGQM